MDPICYFCYIFILVMLSCLFPAALWSPAGKGLTYWLSCLSCFLVFLSLSLMVLRVRYNTFLGVHKGHYWLYYVQKSSILLAGTDVWKITSVACGFSPIKIIFLIT